MRKIHYVFAALLVIAVCIYFGISAIAATIAVVLNEILANWWVLLPVVYMAASSIIAADRRDRKVFAWVAYYESTFRIKLDMPTVQNLGIEGDGFSNQFFLLGYRYRYLIVSVAGLTATSFEDSKPLQLLFNKEQKIPYVVSKNILDFRKSDYAPNVFITNKPTKNQLILCLLFLDFYFRNQAAGLFQCTNTLLDTAYYSGLYKPVNNNPILATMKRQLSCLPSNSGVDAWFKVNLSIKSGETLICDSFWYE